MSWVDGVKDVPSKTVLDDIITHFDSLLRMENDKFWAFMNLCGLEPDLRTVTSILPRPHERQGAVTLNSFTDGLTNNERDVENGKIDRCVHRLFLLVARLTDCYEIYSGRSQSIIKHFQMLVYSKFIIDIPLIFDLCSLFGHTNVELWKKCLTNMFDSCPVLLEDLELYGRYLSSDIIINLIDEVEIWIVTTGKESLNLPALSKLAQLVNFMFDSFHGLEVFFAGYPSCIDMFIQQFQFTDFLADFYHLGILKLLIEVQKRFNVLPENTSKESDAYVHLSYVKVRLQMLRDICISMLRTFVTNKAIQHAYSTEQSVVNNASTQFFSILQETMSSYATLIMDYNKLFPIEDDISLFDQVHAAVDKSVVDHIMQQLDETKVISYSQNDESNLTAEIAKPRSTTNNPSSSKNSDVTALIDMFPHLSVERASQALQYFSNDLNQAVNAAMEDNLPPPQPTPDTDNPLFQSSRQSSSNVIEREYDPSARISSFPIDGNTLIYKGKRDQNEGVSKVLEDSRSQMKHDISSGDKRFQHLKYIKDTIFVSPEDDLYDDEYDDTYELTNQVEGTIYSQADDEPLLQDSNGKGAVNDHYLNEKNEQFLDKKFETPRVLLNKRVDDGDVRHQKSDNWRQFDDNDWESNDNTLRIRDPAEIRMFNEMKRHESGQRRYVPPPNSVSSSSSTSTRDVVGNKKGQGQSKEVLRNRAHKSQHKSKKQQIGADKKYSRGMF